MLIHNPNMGIFRWIMSLLRRKKIAKHEYAPEKAIALKKDETICGQKFTISPHYSLNMLDILLHVLQKAPRVRAVHLRMMKLKRQLKRRFEKP